MTEVCFGQKAFRKRFCSGGWWVWNRPCGHGTELTEFKIICTTRRHVGSFLEGLVWSWQLESMIRTGPFQLGARCDSVSSPT